jgi:hypothetical protein
MEAELCCRCGKVQGSLANPSAQSVNRVICYCADCQAFLHHLRRPDLLDVHGGTDIIQVAPGSLSFVRGTDRITGLRLTPKGLHRWYASCCKTPLGNTVSAAIPFVGIVAQAFECNAQRPDDLFGKPIGGVFAKYAIGSPPEASPRISPRLLAHAMCMVIGWRLRGKGWPHPYFDRVTRAPIYPVTVLSASEREALRTICGPRAW